MNAADEYVKLQKLVRRLQRKVDKLRGAEEQHMKRLKELGCDSLEQAIKAHKKLKSHIRKLKDKFKAETRKVKNDLSKIPKDRSQTDRKT